VAGGVKVIDAFCLVVEGDEDELDGSLAGAIGSFAKGDAVGVNGEVDDVGLALAIEGGGHCAGGALREL